MHKNANIIFTIGDSAFKNETAEIKKLVDAIRGLEALRAGGNFDYAEKILELKRELVSLRHKGKITPPTAKVNRWSTHIKIGARSTIGGKDARKQVRGKNEEEMLNEAIKTLYPCFCPTNITIKALFEEWNSKDVARHPSKNSYKRYNQIYQKYMAGNPLEKMYISDISEKFLKDEYISIIQNCNLTRKAWYNFKSIMNRMYLFAVDNKYCADNTSKNIKLGQEYSHIFQQAKKKTAETEIYFKKETSNLITAIDRKYASTGDNALLAIKFDFYTGLRVGELVALKWEDIHWNSGKIHIRCEEVRSQKDKSTKVVPHTKSYEERNVDLLPEAVKILKLIPKDDEYIFTKNGERITARQVTHALKKVTTENNIKYKSPHKIRKTYASYLNAEGIQITYIRDLLGHRYLSTTISYLYSLDDDIETIEKMRKALSVSGIEG